MMRHKKSKIVVIGDSPITDDVVDEIKKLRAVVEKENLAAYTMSSIYDDFDAAVLVEPVTKGLILLRKANSTAEKPVFVITPDNTPQNKERSFYKYGAEAVFEWPREKVDLTRLLMSMLAIEARQKPKKADNTFKQAIRKRLQVEGNIFNDITVNSVNGVVSLHGEVDTIWQEKYIEEIVSDIPGVKGLVLGGLKVRGKLISEQKLQRIIDSLIKDNELINPKTLEIDVCAGVVNIKGIVDDEHEVGCLEAILSRIKGVRKINKIIYFSRKEKEKAIITANRIKRTGKFIYPNDLIKVSVFGGICVLKGVVQKISHARNMVKIIHKMDSIVRIVNKLRVL
ncbi:BON domain-containing protein [Candidatus Riflebacteria bacterium]